MEGGDGADPENERANVGDNPVRLGLSRPSVHEKTDGDKERERDDDWHTEFRFALPPRVLCFELLIYLVAGFATKRSTDEEAETERDVIETGDADTLAIHVHVEFRKGGQSEVEDTVGEGHVQRHDLDNRLREQHAKRSAHCDHDLLPDRLINLTFTFGAVTEITRLFAEHLGFLVEDVRGVGFVELPESTDKDEHIDNRGCIEHPPPGRFLSHPRSHYGADGRTKQWAHGIEAHRLSTLFGLEEITKDTTTDGKGSGAPKARQEAESHKLFLGLREATSGIESKKQEVGGLEDNDTSIQFGQRTQDHWADCVGQNEDG